MGAGDFPARRHEFPAPARKIPCAAAERNSRSLLQVTGNTASTHFETAKTGPISKKLPAKFPAAGNSRMPMPVRSCRPERSRRATQSFAESYFGLALHDPNDACTKIVGALI